MFLDFVRKCVLAVLLILPTTVTASRKDVLVQLEYQEANFYIWYCEQEEVSQAVLDIYNTSGEATASVFVFFMRVRHGCEKDMLSIRAEASSLKLLLEDWRKWGEHIVPAPMNFGLFQSETVYFIYGSERW